MFILLFSLSVKCKLDELINCRPGTMTNPFPVKHTFNWPMLIPPPPWDSDWQGCVGDLTLSFWNTGCHNHRSFNRNTYKKKTSVILVSFIILLKKYQCTILYLTVGKSNIRGIFQWMYILSCISVITYFPWTDCYIVDLIAATCLVILLKFYPNHRFFSPCELEIWCMT